MFFVVPLEEVDGEGSGIVDGAETIREAGTVFPGISGYGTGFPNKDCHSRREDSCGFW